MSELTSNQIAALSELHWMKAQVENGKLLKGFEPRTLNISFQLISIEPSGLQDCPPLPPILGIGITLTALKPVPLDIRSALYYEALQTGMVLADGVHDDKNLYFPKANTAFFCGGPYKGEFEVCMYEIVPVEPEPKKKPFKVSQELLNRDGV